MSNYTYDDARQSLDALHLAHDTRWPILQCPLCAPLSDLVAGAE